QIIRSIVTFVIFVTFDPFEAHAARTSIPMCSLVSCGNVSFILHAMLIKTITLLQHIQYFLDQVFVLHWFLRRIDPIIALPVVEPVRHAVDRVFAVTNNDNLAIFGCHLKCAHYCGQLSSLISLFRSIERLADVPSVLWPKVNSHTTPRVCAPICERAAICPYAYRRILHGSCRLILILLSLFPCFVPYTIRDGIQN
ncbi:uncharacterized protein SEPMUDRAFT_39498, partial [Sphaerulina musiva SO2202]